MAVSPPVATEPAPGVARPLAPEGVVVVVPPPPTVGDGSVVAVVAGVVGVGGVVAAVVGAWAAVVGGIVRPLIGGCVSGGLVVVVARVEGVVEPPAGRVVGAVEGAVEGAAVPAVVVSLPLRTTTVATPAPKTPTINTVRAMPRSRLSCSPSSS